MSAIARHHRTTVTLYAMTEPTVKEIGHQWIVYVDGLSIAALCHEASAFETDRRGRLPSGTHKKTTKTLSTKKVTTAPIPFEKAVRRPRNFGTISVPDSSLFGLRPATLGASTHIPNRMFSRLSLRRPRLATILSCRWQMPRSLR